MKKILKYAGISLFVLILIAVIMWMAGPKAEFEAVNPKLPELDVSISDLDEYLAQKEAAMGDVKPGNESRIIWADSVRQTEYALVYLHGFSAGPMEGAPLHMEVAKRYGMNLYLPRLSRHGLSNDDAFLELTPKSLMETAKEALVIGKKIGKEVILMSCSTGGTLGIYLSANHPDIHAHVMYSPNIDLFDGTTDLMTGPWGLEIVRSILGEYREPVPYKTTVPDSVREKMDLYWTGRYRVEGLVALQSLLDQTMTEETFRSVSQPYFMGYYFKSDSAQDSTVSVQAMNSFNEISGTSDEKRRIVAFTDAKSHVINSNLTSKQYDDVQNETFKFFEEILGLVPQPKGN